MLDLSQDVGCRSRPDEWTGVVVVLSNVLINGLRQLCHAAEGSPTDALASDLGKPALHQVQPGSPGGGEVQVIAGMSCEPGLYLEMGMGAVVVEDHMNVPAPGRGPLDALQELQELDVPLARQASTDDGSLQHVERNKQRGGAMEIGRAHV